MQPSGEGPGREAPAVPPLPHAQSLYPEGTNPIASRVWARPTEEPRPSPLANHPEPCYNKSD